MIEIMKFNDIYHIYQRERKGKYKLIVIDWLLWGGSGWEMKEAKKLKEILFKRAL